MRGRDGINRSDGVLDVLLKRPIDRFSYLLIFFVLWWNGRGYDGDAGLFFLAVLAADFHHAVKNKK